MKLENTTTTRKEGGLGIPDIKARNEAIQIMWLKNYLSKAESRPTWAWIADELIKWDANKKAIPKVDEASKISWLQQTWKTKKGKHSKLPIQIKEMLQIAEKHKVSIQARKADKTIKENMIIWLNKVKSNKYKQNKKAANV